ncbi:DNA methyltransferase [Tumidithrix helvetica PCC 7403]|uniref:hypothetical protein n=1 Tax=Tumidithrix helvetica TaxID=3457545 RepID=UPI003CBB28EA
MIQRSPHYDLFHIKPVTRRIGLFGFPADLSNRHQKIQKWLTFAAEAQEPNQQTDAEFLHDIFVDVLGYTSPFHGGKGGWELEFSPEPALGFFTETSAEVVVEIIFYRSGNPLDNDSDNWLNNQHDSKPKLKHASTEWLIVVTYQAICLYHRDISGLFCQQFNLDSLTSIEELKYFYFILCRRRLLKGTAQSSEPSRTFQLLEDSQQLEIETAKNFYSQYSKIRAQLIKDFRYRLQQSYAQLNPQLPPQSETDRSISELANTQIDAEAIAKAQKLLNRILFIAFCEDNHLLPDGLINEAYEFYNPYQEQPIWENYKAIFSWIYQGTTRHGKLISCYHISLFESDKILDKLLFVGDELCRQIKEITRFDFHEDISRTVLTHILEEAVKDLALLKKDMQNLSKRRSTRYPSKALIHSESVKVALREYLLKKATPPLPTSDTTSDTTSESVRAETLAYWRSHQQNLLDLKVLDRRCGSGIFLVTALNFLLAEHEQVHQKLRTLRKQPHEPDREAELDELPEKTTAELVSHILQHNLYGCDRAIESVEITRLHLWLATIQLNPALVSLDFNIQVGDPAACDFGSAFQQAIEQGDAIILGK